MFDALSDKLTGVFDRLRGRGRAERGRRQRGAARGPPRLLDADVALPVVRDFVAKVRERAVGAEVLDSVSPGQQVVKIVNDVMIEQLGGAGAVPLNLNAAAPIPILMVGLQGSGKTTTSGKLGAAAARAASAGACCWRASTRSARPRSCSSRSSPSGPACRACRSSPARRRCRSPAARWRPARREGFDIVILDTAGRLSIDQALMDEVARDPRRDQPGRDAAGGRCDDRPGRGEHRQGVQRGARRHRHRDDPHGRRRARRRRAVDARDHRRADQAHRRRREARRAGGIPPRARRRPHPGHGRHRRPGREGRRDDRPGGGREARPQDGEGQVRPARITPSQLKQITKMGSLSRHPRACCRAWARSRSRSRTPISTRRSSSARRRSSGR